MRHNRIKNYVDDGNKNTCPIQKMELVIEGGDGDDNKEGRRPSSPLVGKCMHMSSMSVALLRVGPRRVA
jgi:hypothetical protein